MTQYFNKDILIAEIERQQRRLDVLRHSNDVESRKTAALQNGVYCYILSVLNTSEVKEVDLDKEFNNFLDNVEGVPRMWHSDEQIVWAKDIAKHFLELGLNLQKCDNKCKDLRDDGVCNFASTKLGRTMHCENISCSRK